MCRLILIFFGENFFFSTHVYFYYYIYPVNSYLLFRHLVKQKAASQQHQYEPDVSLSHPV